MPDTLSKSQIRNIMRAEHKSSGITKINPGLYRALNQYLQKLHEAYLKAHAENKTQKALTLTKEITDTERDISTIYELRERKLLLMAQDIVRGGAPSLKYLFPGEKLLLLRLSSILLETRKDISIDFHSHVDRYIKTIAKEYDLERTLYSPFHPTDPFCEDLTKPQSPPVNADTDISSLPPPKNASSPTSTSTPTGESISQESNLSADISKTPEPDEKGEAEPAPGNDVLGRADDTENITNAAPSDDVRSDPSNESASEQQNELEEDGEDDDDESVDFLKDYAVAGTLESIPQFRADDLHDYRFEEGEVITLPLKMAELLEKQGKLFIVDMEKKQGSG